MNEELTDIEFDILGSVYFIESFEHILEDCKEKPAVVADVLKQLIHKKFIVPMKWDEDKSEFVRSYIYDTDDMKAYNYLATKLGLTAHNSK